MGSGVPGVDTQGPAGSRVPDIEENMARVKLLEESYDVDESPSYHYLQADDAPPDAAGGACMFDMCLGGARMHLNCGMSHEN